MNNNPGFYFFGPRKEIVKDCLDRLLNPFGFFIEQTHSDRYQERVNASVFFYFVLQVSEKMDRFEKPRTKQFIT